MPLSFLIRGIMLVINHIIKKEFIMDKKRTMRHTDEIHAILTAIYCINEPTAKDEDIAKLIEYAFYRVYKEGIYDLKQICVQKQKSDVMPDLLLLLESETEYCL